MGAIYRRVCILRSKRRHAEARRIEESELAAALAKVREAFGAEADTEARIASIMSEEEDRVAAAVAFAEILAPMVAEHLGAAAPGGRRPAAEPAARMRTPGRPDEERGIADFIEEMLVQDRAGTP